MEAEKKQRLLLLGSLAFVFATGLTSKLVKVPIKETTVKIDYIKPKKIIQKVNDQVTYSLDIPEDYLLKLDENGDFIGYRETREEEEKLVTLDEFVMKKIK